MGHNENEIDPVVVENGSFTWDDEGNTAPILKNISMKVNYYFLIIFHQVIMTYVVVEKFQTQNRFT